MNEPRHTTDVDRAYTMIRTAKDGELRPANFELLLAIALRDLIKRIEKLEESI